MRKAAWPLAGVAFVALLFLAVFPTRTYLAQRRDLAATERRVAVLSGENKELAERVERLNTDAEIERLAREQYNLVRPGEEAYAILPPAMPSVPEPGAEGASPASPGFWSKFWDRLTFWS